MGPPPEPKIMFDKFDADDNDQLSREEFTEFVNAIRELRPHGGPPRGEHGGPGGPLHSFGPPPGSPGEGGWEHGPGRGPGREGRPPRPRGEGRGDDRRPRPPRGADAASEDAADETADAPQRPELESPAEPAAKETATS